MTRPCPCRWTQDGPCDACERRMDVRQDDERDHDGSRAREMGERYERWLDQIGESA